MPRQKPKLNLTKGNVYELTLMFDEPKSGQKNGRSWFLYTVRYQNQECIFFTPSQKEHEAIQKLNLGTGDTFVIGVDNDGQWHVSTEAPENMVLDPFSDPKPPPPPPGLPPKSPSRSFETLVEDYQACLGVANTICVAEFESYTNEDVRAIATTLYIQGTREGVAFPKG